MHSVKSGTRNRTTGRQFIRFSLLAFLLFGLVQPVHSAEVCGDGILEGLEECDDGNTIGGDGCSDNCEIEPLEHFMFYKTRVSRDAPRFAKFGPVVLSDQFGSDLPAVPTFDIVKPRQLGLPADKNGEGVADPDTHLQEYRIKAADGTAKFQPLTDIRVVNQCSDLLIEVTKPVSVMLPTLTELFGSDLPASPAEEDHGLDHFLCYRAKTQKKLANGTPLPRFPRGIQVEVSDQFQSRRYDLKKITKLCNPVAKSGDPVFLSRDNRGDPKPIEPASIRNPADHLVCYQTRLARKNIPQVGCGCDTSADPLCRGTRIEPRQLRHQRLTGVQVNNQFGPLQLGTIKNFEFCIPSEKILPVP